MEQSTNSTSVVQPTHTTVGTLITSSPITALAAGLAAAAAPLGGARVWYGGVGGGRGSGGRAGDPGPR